MTSSREPYVTLFQVHVDGTGNSARRGVGDGARDDAREVCAEARGVA